MIKRVSTIVSIIIILLLLCACLYHKNEVTSSNPQVGLSEQEAVSIAKKIIQPKEDWIIIDVDGSVNQDGKEYYIIHEYSVPDIPSGVMSEGDSYLGTFTRGWYRLDKHTKQLYKQDMASKEEKWDLVE